MWIVFLRHFKNLFTTDDIINSTKEEINKILMDLNRQTERNLTLLDNSMAKAKALCAETDKKVKFLSELEEKSLNAAEMNSKFSLSKNKRSAVSAYEKNKSRHKVDSEDTVVLTREGEQFSVQPMQVKLFNEKPEYLSKENTDIFPVNNEIHVNTNGASYAEIPLVSPEVYFPDKTVDLSKGPEDLKTKILKFFDQGYSVDTITKELGCSNTEVQFVLTLEGRL